MADHGYDQLTVIQLKKECRTRGISGYSRLRKAELVERLFADDTDRAEDGDEEEDVEKEDEYIEDDETDDEDDDDEVHIPAHLDADIFRLFEPTNRKAFNQHLKTLHLKFASSVDPDDRRWIILEILRRHVLLKQETEDGILHKAVWRVTSSTYMGRPFYIIGLTTFYIYENRAELEENQGKIFRVDRETMNLFYVNGTNPRWNLKTHRPSEHRELYESLGLIPDWLEDEEVKEKFVPIVAQDEPLTVEDLLNEYHAGNEKDERDLNTIKANMNITFNGNISNSARKLIILLLLRRTANRMFLSKDVRPDRPYRISSGIHIGKPFYRISEQWPGGGRSEFRIKRETFEYYTAHGRVPILNLSDDDYGMSRQGDISKPGDYQHVTYIKDSHELWQRLGLYATTFTKGCGASKSM